MAVTKPIVSPIWANAVSSPPDIDVPSYINTGWPAPGGIPVIPPRGYDNWLNQYAMRGVRYHSSVGLPEWDAAEDQYVPGSVVRDTDGVFYVLVGTATTGVAPSADQQNWTPFGTGRRPEMGDGSDGDVTISTPTSIFADKQYNNLTITAGGVLHMDEPFKIRVRGLLWIKAGGILRFGHLTELNGAAATDITSGGAGGRGSNFYGSGSVGGGSSGGQGGINTSGTDTDSLPFRQGKPGEDLGPHRLGGTGGSGGIGGSSSGGAGSSVALDTGAINLIMALLNGGTGSRRDATTTPKGSATFMLMGGSGGGGGGGPSSAAPADNKHQGGGGGAGGSVGIVTAGKVVTEANGAFYAPGGNGGNATTYGGGGGGGGGYIGVVCDSYTGPTQTAGACCPGGAAGTGGLGESTPGTDGSNGAIDVKVL
jgi:hypothetical protein